MWDQIYKESPFINQVLSNDDKFKAIYKFFCELWLHLSVKGIPEIPYHMVLYNQFLKIPEIWQFCKNVFYIPDNTNIIIKLSLFSLPFTVS